jgi:polyvinyl alcohol dehydrogenase (cytochrome)
MSDRPRPRARALFTATAVIAALAGILIPANAAAACAPDSPGGDWSSYSHDLANSRHQPDEAVIGPAEAANLRASRVLDLGAAGAAGAIDNTPAVAGGCVYIGTNGGTLLAVNADTFQVVWMQTVRAGMRGSPTVQDGKVFVNVNETNKPYTAAFDAASGEPLWETVIDTQPGSGAENSPVVFDGKVLAGVSGFLAESGTTFYGTQQSRLHFRGAWAVLDAATGSLLAKDHVISDEDFDAGFTGGGVWSTPAVDAGTGYAYVGSGNPFSATEHPHTNSILKIDLRDDPASNPTFGQLVDHYHGTNDQYVDAVNHKPTCAAYVDVFTCENFDLDFGASPQLFTDKDGRAMVGALQKSGVYHGVDATDMEGVWETQVGGVLIVFVGNLGTASYDGESIVVGGSGPAVQWGLSPDDGSVQWAAPVADPRHIQPTSTANGVAYSVDSNGVLNIWDARTGEALQTRPMVQDIGTHSTSSGPGVAIARNTVYAPTGAYLVAYR